MDNADRIALLAFRDMQHLEDTDAIAARIRLMVEAGDLLIEFDRESAASRGGQHKHTFGEVVAKMRAAIAHALRETGAERIIAVEGEPLEAAVDKYLAAEPQAEPSGAEDLYDSDTSEPCGKDGAR